MIFTKERTVNGVIAIGAIAAIGLFVWCRWGASKPVSLNGKLSAGLPQPIGNTGAVYSNSQAAPDPNADVSTSWVTNATAGGGTAMEDSYSPYFEDY